MPETSATRELQCLLLGFLAARYSDEWFLEQVVDKPEKRDWPELVPALPAKLDESSEYDAHLLDLFQEMQKALDERA